MATYDTGSARSCSYLYGNAAVAQFIAEVYKAEGAGAAGRSRGGGIHEALDPGRTGDRGVRDGLGRRPPPGDIRRVAIARPARTKSRSSHAKRAVPARQALFRQPDQDSIRSCSISTTRTRPAAISRWSARPCSRGFKGKASAEVDRRASSTIFRRPGNHYSGTRSPLVDASHVRLKGLRPQVPLQKPQTWTRVERTAHPGAAVPAPPSGR